MYTTDMVVKEKVNQWPIFRSIMQLIQLSVVASISFHKVSCMIPEFVDLVLLVLLALLLFPAHVRFVWPGQAKAIFVTVVLFRFHDPCGKCHFFCRSRPAKKSNPDCHHSYRGEWKMGYCINVANSASVHIIVWFLWMFSLRGGA